MTLAGGTITLAGVLLAVISGIGFWTANRHDHRGAGLVALLVLAWGFVAIVCGLALTLLSLL